MSAERLSLARRHGTQLELLRELLTFGLECLVAGEVAQFDQVIAEATVIAERSRAPHHMLRVHLTHAMAAGRAGRFDEARACIATAEACDPGPGGPAVPLLMFCRLGLARITRDVEYLRRERATLSRFLTGSPSGYAFWAWVCAALGEADAARASLAQAPADLRGRPLAQLSFLGDAAIVVGDRAAARRLYDTMLPFATDCVLWGLFGFTAEGVVHRSLGALAGCLDEGEAADDHFRQAADHDRRTGSLASLACVLEDWSLFLRHSSDPSHHARAAATAADAVSLLEQLGLGARAERLRAEFADAAPTSIRSAPIALLEITRDGDVFRLRLGNEEVRVRDSKGMRYLEVLAARPGVEVHVLELVTAEAGEPELGRADSDAGPVLDAPAKEAYRRRLGKIEAELATAATHGDVGRGLRLEAERDALIDELARATGLGGRERRVGSRAERARVNVQRRLRAAISTIRKNSEKIASHATRSTRTGLFCAYDPPAVE